MSLAYKLWRIGSVLNKDDVHELMNENHKIPDDPQYLMVDFKIKNNQIREITVKKNAVSKKVLLITQKIGGTSNAYYLYPNIIIKNDIPCEKLKNLQNTIKESICFFANKLHREIAEAILRQMDNVKAKLAQVQKGTYVFLFSINGKTFYECMPEVWDNWVMCPFIKNDNLEQGQDVFTNKEGMVGYHPDVKVFSYDNYHDSLKHRLNKNYGLSAESARNIRFGWMFAMANLFFRYKGQEYCIIPNMINFTSDTYKEILKKYKELNCDDRGRDVRISELTKQEKAIRKKLEKTKGVEKKDVKNIEVLKSELQEKENELLLSDVGFFKKSEKELDHMSEYRNVLMLDYYFFALDRKNKSFQIKGVLEDILPSRISQVVEKLRENKIDENITYSPRERNGFISLKHYFSRKEIEIFYTKGFSGRKDFANTVLKERIYLARLFLLDEKITMDNLLARFEHHREMDYNGKKRVHDGVKDWIQYSRKYRKAEDRIIAFLNALNIIKE